jgi:uncharacterized protein
MHSFSVATPLLGGILIGVAASGLLLLNGRIAGISGICGELLPLSGADSRWQLAFVGGLITGGLILLLVHPASFGISPCSLPILTAAGLLMGLGTRIGNGCTSGHGVCGLARRSRRSLVATATLLAAGIITVFLINRLFGSS